MTTKSSITATGSYVKDTAKGKKHYAVEGRGVVGAIYLTPEVFEALGEPETIKVTVTA